MIVKTIPKRSLNQIFVLENELPATYNTELDKYLKKIHNKNGYKFIGIVMRDEVRKLPCPSKCFFIVNYDESHQGGSHWIAVVKSGTDVYHFGSYGISPLKEIKTRFSNCNIYYNDRSLQLTGSNICGHLCLAFIEHMIKKNSSFYKFISDAVQSSNRFKKDIS